MKHTHNFVDRFMQKSNISTAEIKHSDTILLTNHWTLNVNALGVLLLPRVSESHFPTNWKKNIRKQYIGSVD